MAEAFTNTTDTSGLTYNTYHIQNRTNTQDPSKYKYAPGADLDIYNIVSQRLSSFVSFLVNTLNIIKKNISEFFEQLYEYTIYIIILIIVFIIFYIKRSTNNECK